MVARNGSVAEKQAAWEFDVDRISVADVEGFLEAVNKNKLTAQAEIMARYTLEAPVEAISPEGFTRMPFKQFVEGRDEFVKALGDLAKN